MNQSINSVVIAMAMILGTASVLQKASAADQHEEGPNGTLQAVRLANEGFYAALNAFFAGDIGPMETVWSHAADVTFFPPGGERLMGWDAIRANWEKLARLKLGGKVEARDVHVVILGPSAALVVNTEVGNNTHSPAGPIKVNIRATNVYRRESGAWKMIHHHTDILPQLADIAR